MKLLSFDILLILLCSMCPQFGVIELRVGQKRTAHGRFLKSDGSAGTVDGVPSWAGENPEVFTAVVSDDGLSCDIIAVAPGSADLTFSGDGDLGEGVVTISASDNVVVLQPLGADQAVFDVSDAVPV